MRIIRGKFKGRKIIPPKNLPVRPTTDFAKEALFNSLENQLDLEGLNVLDLFAGTGNMSFEFVSRGAASCLSVEQNSGCIRFIGRMAKELQMDQLTVHRMDVFRFIKRKHGHFDLVFADPPYDLDCLADLPDLLYSSGLLNSGGTFVLEHGRDHDFSKHEFFEQSKRYGNVNFTLFYDKTS